ncbi:hypothetical protein [Streptomyces sp. AP-93]|uniref:class III lanthionine synthetase LanKC N-terminal domain-containing protein n=1 Tax=Streptomyces sp. AP-93 TaxID=2929048 RepID=UPI001FAFA400|nr:hypothetical protein [Streptomyces sp. AP-93]MCJ0873259.1 hypothetical protein [Streptomyces sp. AP-93]
MDFLPFLLADRDFYRPIDEITDIGVEHAVDALPQDGSQVASGVWTVCVPAEGFGAASGWKVHVSAALDRAQQVLDTTSAICVEQGVPFKYLSNSVFYTWQHHKQGSRAQSGKFIAAYPADVEAARRLMEVLASALEGERGPHILGDRRYREGSVVAYRYGAFAEIPRLRPDGTTELLVPDREGRLVKDERGIVFTLPEGIEDPFAIVEAPPAATAGRTPSETSGKESAGTGRSDLGA